MTIRTYFTRRAPSGTPERTVLTESTPPLRVAHTQGEDKASRGKGLHILALLRLATGFIFLWAFLDKTFGLGFSTPADRAWVAGGTPSQGFLLSDGVTGPLKGLFTLIASPASDILFQLGMLGIGMAVMLGIGLRVSAVVGSFLMVMMYLAEWPFAANTTSTNPLVDYHIIYALTLVLLAASSAGDTWGAGRPWRKLPIVHRRPWLL
ncbi:DoxX family protein [Arthrobacter cheniae]|uniref:DoxX family protein n=1 Tax=Arthrobacter cheniae TaxID=1258888 RepID=UPI001C7D0F1C|nr:DoxX family protein [Arthrobacter cheniae]